MEKTKRVYRLCPCAAYDMEAIQTWLEDLAEEGLFLEQDSIFCGFWGFLPGTPRKTVYRLDIARSQGLFSEGSPDPEEEMLDTAREMGWEYVTKYHFFHIYRSCDPQATPLNSDPLVQAIGIRTLKKKQRSALIWEVVYLLALFFLRSNFVHFFLNAVSVGPVFALAVPVLVLSVLISIFRTWLCLRRYEKRLRSGQFLDQPKPWRKGAVWSIPRRLLPIVLGAVILIAPLKALVDLGNTTPLTQYAAEVPFPTVEDLFPGGTVTQVTDFGNYGTVAAYTTALSENIEWNESCDVTAADGTNYYCILRAKHYDTAVPWIAAGLAWDIYNYEAQRYHGQRFQDITTLEKDGYAVRVFSSYGITHVLVRQGSTVTDAVITIHADGVQENQWQLWLDAACP